MVVIIVVIAATAALVTRPSHGTPTTRHRAPHSTTTTADRSIADATSQSCPAVTPRVRVHDDQVHQLDRDATLRGIRVANQPVADLLARQTVLRFPGGIDQDRVVGETAAGRALVRTEAGRRFAHDLLHGFAQIARSEDSDPDLSGIVLTDSDEGYAAAFASLIAVDSGVVSSLVAQSGVQETVTRFFDDRMRAIDRGELALYHPVSDWIVIGPRVSRLLRGEQETSGLPTVAYPAYILRHEFEHSVSPEPVFVTIISSSSLAWLDEGTASTLARWPGAVDTTARLLGLTRPLPRDRSAAFDDVLPSPDIYDAQVETVRSVLRLAGVDPTKQSELPRAAALLQTHPLQVVPYDLAATILARHDIANASCRALGDEIAHLNGDPAKVRKLEALLESFATQR